MVGASRKSRKQKCAAGGERPGFRWPVTYTQDKGSNQREVRALSSSMRRGRVSAKSCPQAPKSIGVCFLPDHVKKPT